MGPRGPDRFQAVRLHRFNFVERSEMFVKARYFGVALAAWGCAEKGQLENRRRPAMPSPRA
ncbi:hypothetical protein CSIRO_1841 [Bradyrhizobiaceae bacterium SG-6C]|nr:hypothetical protein CSIRO_1841 [Bradyrhizobiaceae bacterium SG-6C]